MFSTSGCHRLGKHLSSLSPHAEVLHLNCKKMKLLPNRRKDILSIGYVVNFQCKCQD